MKKRIQKALALLCVMAMTVCSLVGCGGSSDNQGSTGGNEVSGNTEVVADGQIDLSEEVELKMYLIGDRTADFDEVYGEVNKILKEKLNCTLTVDFLSWSEYLTKYSLLFSSGEEFDLIFTASSWGCYEQTAGMGGFYALTDEFIQTYAPDVVALLPSVAWDQAKIDGSIYMVPYNSNDFVSNAWAVRGDLMEKYGFEDISNWEEYKAFNIACAEDGIYGSQGIAWWQFFQGNGMYIVNGTPKQGEFFLYNTQDPSNTEIEYVLEWDGFAQYCKDVKAMADAGAWSPDIINSTDERQTGLLNGTTASMVWNLGSCLLYGKQANAEHPEWNVTMVDCNADVAKIMNPYINGGMGININSNNKERAMMVINELYTNADLQDLTMLGIEGKHWEAVGEGQYKIIDASGFPTDGTCNWGWSNRELRRSEYIENRTALDDTYESLMASFNANIKEGHPLDGFSFSTSNVTTQMASVEAVISTYYGPLMYGLVDDVDATIAKFKAEMEAAGIQDIIAELEAQKEAYLAK